MRFGVFGDSEKRLWGKVKQLLRNPPLWLPGRPLVSCRSPHIDIAFLIT
jgi:hypothetical protein